MPDLSALLSKPAGEAKKPPLLPVGNYPCVITGTESVKSSKKKTDGIQFNFVPTEWPDDVEEDDKEGVDLSKKKLRHTIYVTEDSMWSLDEFLRDTLKLEMGRPYAEIIPECVGCNLLAMVVHTQGSKGDDIAVVDRVGPLE